MDVTNHQPSERELAWARANRAELVERLGQALRHDGRIYPLKGLMLDQRLFANMPYMCGECCPCAAG